MKKFLAFAIIAVMLFMSVMPVSAEVPPPTREDMEYEAFRTYCLENNSEPGALAEVTIYDRLEMGDITYFTGGSWLEPGGMGSCEVIGDWCVHSNDYQYPYELGVYVYKDDVVYSLREAYDQGVINNVSAVRDLEFITVHYAGEDVTLTHRCIDAFMRYKNFAPDKNSYIECKVYGEKDDIVFFRAYIADRDECMVDVCSQQRIGGYIFEYGYVIGPKDNPTGLYILKDSEVIPAPKAYEEGEVYIEDLVNIVGAQEDPYDVKAKVFEKLGYPTDGSTVDEWLTPFYREIYAHYENPSTTSAYDPDYVLVHASLGPGEPAAPADRIGDYAVGSYEWCDNYRHGLYVYVPATGELHTLESAVEDTADIEGIGEAFQHLGARGGMIGDADKDGKITVKDATYIQKILADVEVNNPYAYYENVVDLIRDFNRDNKVNVQDATAIQKFLAGLDY